MVLLEPLDRTAVDFEYAFDLKRAAVESTIDENFGWDEGFERELHRSRWDERRFFAIQNNRATVGTVAIDVFEDHIALGEFYIAPELGGQGIDDAVLQGVLLRAELMGVPVRVECFRDSAALDLYREHGFAVVNETSTHVALERFPDVTGHPNRLLA